MLPSGPGDRELKLLLGDLGRAGRLGSEGMEEERPSLSSSYTPSSF